jgi:hypothetical protein
MQASYRRSLQSSEEDIQHVKTLNFFTFYILLVIFDLLDTDPYPHSQCGSKSGSSGPKSMQIHAYPESGSTTLVKYTGNGKKDTVS